MDSLANANAIIDEIANDYPGIGPQEAGQTLAANYQGRFESMIDGDDPSEAELECGEHLVGAGRDLVAQVRNGNIGPSVLAARAAAVLAYAILEAGGGIADHSKVIDQLNAIYSAMADYVATLARKLA